MLYLAPPLLAWSVDHTNGVLRKQRHQSNKCCVLKKQATCPLSFCLLKFSLCHHLLPLVLPLTWSLSLPGSLSLVWNGTWNDQHTFPLGGLDWFMWELLQSFAFLVLICPGRWKGEQSKLMAQTSAAFSFLWNVSVMPGLPRGSYKSQGNNEEERRVTGEAGGV